MAPREIIVPYLRIRPTLLQVLAMEQGRLALWTFGKPTDSVFGTVSTEPVCCGCRTRRAVVEDRFSRLWCRDCYELYAEADGN